MLAIGTVKGQVDVYLIQEAYSLSILMAPGFVHFIAQEHFYSQREGKLIFTHAERVHLIASYSHHLSPGYLIVWSLLFSGEMGHVSLNLLMLRTESNPGFSFPNQV